MSRGKMPSPGIPVVVLLESPWRWEKVWEKSRIIKAMKENHD
jgi:hypothetical protein